MQNVTIRCILPIFLLIFPTFLYSQFTKIYLQRQYPAIRVENQIWFGQQHGLYQYRPDDDAFKKFALLFTQQNREIKLLYFYDEWLWCVLDSGLAALHTRLGEWYYFDSSSGLPSDTVNALTFENDYVWAATNRGAARFDLLIEEWEIYNENIGLTFLEVRDISYKEDLIWMLGKYTLSEYDPRFEKWRYFPVNQDSTVISERLFQLGREIWVVCNKGMLRFVPDLQTWQPFYQDNLNEENLLEIILEDNRIWAITKSGLFFYEQTSGVWREFSGNDYLQGMQIIDGSINAQQIWILVEDRVLLWDREKRTWEFFDYASGLSYAQYKSIHIEGTSTFLLNPSIIEYRQNMQSPWRRFLLKDQAEKGPSGKGRIFKNLFDNESGGYLPIGKYRWGWEGTRAVFLEERQYNLDESEVEQTVSGQRLDIKSQFNLSRNRTFSGYYNDADFSEVVYGTRYRSRTNDLLQEFIWGDFRNQIANNPFGESVNFFGSSIWMQTGKKTPRFKRSLITLKAHSGEQRSQKTYEFSQGVLQEFEKQNRDIDYIKNQFFSIPNLDTLGSPPELIEIYVDDLNPDNNNPNTNIYFNIAGIQGDFDLWKEIEDYIFYTKVPSIRFLTFLPTNWIVAIRFLQNGVWREGLLQYGESISTAMQNVYFLGGQNIIAYTFSLRIVDSLEMEIPLDYFGLDDDGDMHVDSRWLDFVEGFLFFPQARPFPDPVYNEQNPTSFNRILANYETELPVIQLEHNNLVRGSETVRLDSRIATGGNDYVVDYTNGTLIFVREGLVNPDTRIEIEYEYFLDKHDRVHGAGLNLSPSDNFFIQGNWLHISPDEEFTADTVESTNLLNMHGELRHNFKSVDVRIIPGIAYHPDDENAAGTSLEGLISSSRFRFQSLYQHYAENYRNLYRPQFVLGPLKRRLQFYATVDALEYLRFTGEWQKLHGFSTPEKNNPTDEIGSSSLLLHHGKLPALELSYTQFLTQLQGQTSRKYFWESRLDYQLSDLSKRKLFISSLRLEALLRSGEQENGTSSLLPNQKFNQALIRFNTAISQRFQAGILYRIRNVKDNSIQNVDNPVSRSERLLLDLSHEEWRLFQFNLRLENNLTNYYHRDSDTKNLNLRYFSQVNVRFFPGHLWRPLSPFSFDMNYNRSMNGAGTLRQDQGNWLWWVSDSKIKKLENYQRLENYYLKNEFRPSAWWFLYSLIEFSPQENSVGGSKLRTKFWRWSEKIDLRLGWKTHLILQYREFYQDREYGRIDHYYEPSGQLEYRLSQDFLNILNLLYRHRINREGRILDVSDRWEARYDINWRKYPFLKLRGMEFRQGFAISHLDQSGYNASGQLQLSTSSVIDLYPVHSLIIRLRADWSDFQDNFFPLSNSRALLISIRVSLRM